MRRKKTKLVDFETSRLLKDIGYIEPCFFYYTIDKTLMMSDVRRDYNNYMIQSCSSVPYTKVAIEWLEEKLTDLDLELFNNRYAKSRKAREELRDLELLNNLIEFYRRKYLNNGNRI